MTKVVVEKNEYIRTHDGEVLKVNKNIPSHDDKTLIENGVEKKVKPGKGGIVLNNPESVIASGEDFRDKDSKFYTEKDDEIKFLKQEAIQFSKSEFDIDIKPYKSTISPSKVIDLVMEKVGKVTDKYSKIHFNPNSKTSINSANANKIVLERLPTIEDVYDKVFNYTESKKSENKLMSKYQ